MIEAVRCNAVNSENQNCTYDKGHKGPHEWDKEAINKIREAESEKDEDDNAEQR